jgi:hypothetical protein
MGADITFYKGEKDFYFRDSYNSGNLAWKVGLSYWNYYKKSKKAKIEFFIKLSKITDEQIKKFVEEMHRNPEEKNIVPDVKGWTKEFKKARDEIKKNLNIIKNADRITWSV